jgi:rhodanese-related sulfurtransferase
MTEAINPKQAYEWLKNGEAVLIDVREPDEFSAEHIAYASSLPLALVRDLFKIMDIPEGRKVLFQCKKGGRGGQACALVAGLPDIKSAVFNIDGGIDGWKAEGLPVIGAAGPKIPIFRQVQMIIGTLLFTLIVMGLAGIGFAFMLAAMIAGVFAFTGFIGWCGLALLLQKMPWNR